MIFLNFIKSFFKKKNNVLDPDIEQFEEGFNQFQTDAIYNEPAYFSMINLFCKTNGNYLDLKHAELTKSYQLNKLDANLNSIIGVLDSSVIDDYVSQIKLKGYTVFNNKFPQTLLKGLETFMLTKKCKYAPCF